MKKMTPLLALGACVLAMVGTGCGGGDDAFEGTPALGSIPADVLADMGLPAFTMTNQDGDRVTRDDVFDDQWTVMSFVFTRCTLACPVMSGQLVRLQGILRNANVQYVSISVDPDHDTPEQLLAYRSRFEAGAGDLSGWILLQPNSFAEVVEIAEGGMKMALTIQQDVQIAVAGQPALAGQEAQTMANIDHPTRFFLIGPDGSVRGTVEAMNAGDVERFAGAVLKMAGRK